MAGATWVHADSDAGISDLHPLDLLGGGVLTSRAKEAGTLGDPARHLPQPKGPRLGIRVPGPLGTPRNMYSKEMYRFLWAPWPQLSGTFALTGVGQGSSDFRILPLRRPFLLPGWLLDRGGRNCKRNELRIDKQGDIGPGGRTTGAWFYVHLLCGLPCLPALPAALCAHHSSPSTLTWGLGLPLNSRLQVSGGPAAWDHSTPRSWRADTQRRGSEPTEAPDQTPWAGCRLPWEKLTQWELQLELRLGSLLRAI